MQSELRASSCVSRKKADRCCWMMLFLLPGTSVILIIFGEVRFCFDGQCLPFEVRVTVRIVRRYLIS